MNSHNKSQEVKDNRNIKKEELTHQDIKKMQEELEKCKSEADKYRNQFLRALADYQNLEKRVSEDRIETRKMAQIAVLNRLLPILDNLNQAEVFVQDPGLKLVKDSLIQMLTELGLKEIELLGKEFDPHIAEAIELVEGEKDNIVVEVVKKGYELNGKVIRPGQVKVSKKVHSK